MLSLIKKFVKSLPYLRTIIQERDQLRLEVANLQQQQSKFNSIEKSAAPLLQKDLPVFENYGYCSCCVSTVRFVAYGSWWRDQYLCKKCGSIPRERALMYCIDSFFPAWRNLTIHESSPSNRAASLRLKNECPAYIGTQYYPDVPSGTIYNDFRCENLESLSFQNDSIDLHITQDVFEHIFNPDKAFTEIARTLKPGGAHIFTVPIVNKNNPTEVCARMATDGKVENFREPEYHGNPISEDGSLVTTRWGYDICDFIFKCSGLFTKVVILNVLDLGIRAEYIDVFITEKPLSLQKRIE